MLGMSVKQGIIYVLYLTIVYQFKSQCIFC